MLLLNKALANTYAMDEMNEGSIMTAHQDGQSFPVEVFNEQDFITIDEERIKFIGSKIISDAGYRSGRLGVVLVDNPTSHASNMRFLGHDYPTDVISFCIDHRDTHLEIELVVSAEMAQINSEEYDWDKESELMLYVIHGILHQIGYDDKTEQDSLHMRQMEAEYLRFLGIEIDEEDEGDLPEEEL